MKAFSMVLLVIALALALGFGVVRSVRWGRPIRSGFTAWHSVAGAIPISLADLVAGRVPPLQPDGQPPRVILAAYAIPGPEGIERAPQSGAPCLWFRSILTTIPAEFDPRHARNSAWFPTPDAEMPSFIAAPQFGLPAAPVRDDLSAPPLYLADPREPGRILTAVQPSGQTVDSTTMTVGYQQRAGFARGGVWQAEWIIAPGSAVTIVGIPATAPQGVDDHRRATAPMLVSTRPIAMLQAMNPPRRRRA